MTTIVVDNFIYKRAAVAVAVASELRLKTNRPGQHLAELASHNLHFNESIALLREQVKSLQLIASDVDCPN